MKALIIGLGVSGVSSAKVLKNRGYEIYYYDKKVVNKEYKRIKMSDLKNDALFFDIVIKSPGIKNSDKIVELARLKTFDFTNDIEYAYRLMPRGIKIIAVTGTNGKTTVATYIYTLLKQCSKDCYLCGNIGVSPLEYLDKFTHNSYVVMELSSFQIEMLRTYHPKIVVITNLSPNHLDMVSLDYYYLSKLRLCHLLKEEDILYCGDKIKEDFKISSAFKCNVNADLFSLIGDKIFYKKEVIGEVNHLNKYERKHLLLALSIVYNFFPKVMLLKKGIKEIKKVPFRLEKIICNYPLTMINDAKSSNADSLLKAIDEYQNDKKIIIVGGINKSQGFTKILLEDDDIIFGYGRDGKEILKELQKGEYISTLKEILETIRNRKYENYVVLFSPACSSFDQYHNYIERGNEFNNLVKELFDDKK